MSPLRAVGVCGSVGGMSPPTPSPKRRPKHAGTTKRKGAFLVETKAEGWILRWQDPISKKRRQISLKPLGITNAKDRQAFAEKKSGELLHQKRQLAGVENPRDLSPSAVVELHLAMLTDSSRSSRGAGLRRLGKRLEAAGVKSMLRVDRAAMADMRDAFANGDGAAGSRQFWISISGTFFRWARLHAYCLVAPDDINDAHEGIQVDQEMVEVFQPGQVRDMLDTAILADEQQPQYRMGGPWLLALTLLGCRPHELWKLTWADIQLDAHRLTIGAKGRKTGRARYVSFDVAPSMVALLKAVKRLRPPSRESHPFGFSKTSCQRLVDRLKLIRCRDDGTELRLPEGFQMRTIRRTVASVLATSAHVGIGAAALRGGHSSRTLQRDYLGHLVGVPRDATTVESMLGIQGQADRIIGLLHERA